MVIQDPKAWLADPKNWDEQRERLEKAKTQLLTDHTCIGGVIVRLEVILDASVETACTNGKVIRFNPLFVATLSRSELLFVFGHECIHVALYHCTRRGTRDPQTYNVACDAVDNRVLVKAGLTIPPGAVWLPQYDELCEEEIYAILQKENEGKEPGEDEGGEIGGDGGGKTRVTEEPADEPNPGSTEDGEAPGEGQDEEQDEGQGQDEGPYERPDVGTWGEVEDLTHEDGSALTEEEKNTEEVEQAISNASTQRLSKLIGDQGSAFGEALAGAIEASGHDWRSELDEFITANAAGDPEESWEKVDRRAVVNGDYWPGTETQGLGKVAILADCSGSMSTDEFTLALEHCKEIIEEIEPECVALVQFDHEVQSAEVFDGGDELGEIKRNGYGGTLIAPPFRWLAESGEDWTCAIVLTDLGIFDWEEVPHPNFPVIFADCSGYWSSERVPFGKKIKVTK